MVEDRSNSTRSSSSHALTFTSPDQCRYDCPYDEEDCESTIKGGTIPELVTHLEDYHGARMNDRFKFNHLYVHELSSNTVTSNPEVFNCYGNYFCFHFQPLNLGDAFGYIMFLWFLGEDEEAKKFSYTLEISGNGQTLTYKGVPRSIRISSEELCDDLDGMVFSKFFWEENEEEGKLAVKGCICLEH